MKIKDRKSPTQILDPSLAPGKEVEPLSLGQASHTRAAGLAEDLLQERLGDSARPAH